MKNICIASFFWWTALRKTLHNAWRWFLSCIRVKHKNKPLIKECLKEQLRSLNIFCPRVQKSIFANHQFRHLLSGCDIHSRNLVLLLEVCYSCDWCWRMISTEYFPRQPHLIHLLNSVMIGGWGTLNSFMITSDLIPFTSLFLSSTIELFSHCPRCRIRRRRYPTSIRLGPHCHQNHPLDDAS